MNKPPPPPPPVAKPAAKQGDLVTGTDIHIVLVPSPGGPVPTPMPMPFAGMLDGALATDIVCEGRPIATQGSTATNTAPHIPAPGPFQKPPANLATILTASISVFAPGGGVARAGEPVARPRRGPRHELPGWSRAALGTSSVQMPHIRQSTRLTTTEFAAPTGPQRGTGATVSVRKRRVNFVPWRRDRGVGMVRPWKPCADGGPIGGDERCSPQEQESFPAW